MIKNENQEKDIPKNCHCVHCIEYTKQYQKNRKRYLRENNSISTLKKWQKEIK